MPGKKTPKVQPTLKWDSYKVGTMRELIMRELNVIAQQKEYRQKKGLESSGLRDVKGNPHWQLHATIELLELLSKQIDDGQKFSFFRTNQQLNASINRLDQLSMLLQNTGQNLNENVIQSKNTLIKSLAEESKKLELIQQNMNDTYPALKNQGDELKSDLKKITKILKNSLDSGITGLTGIINTEVQKIVDKIESNGNQVSENISAFRKFFETETFGIKEEANKYIESLISNLDSNQSKLIEELNNFSTNFSSILNENVQKIEKQLIAQNTNFTNLINKGIIDLINNKILPHQEVVNNSFKEHNSKIITEINQVAEASEKQRQDLLQDLTSKSEENTNKLSNQLEEFNKIQTDQINKFKHASEVINKQMMEEIITNSQENTNNLLQHLDELNEGNTEQINEFKISLDKKLTQEIADLRSVLGTIRADIDLMKSVLTHLS